MDALGFAGRVGIQGGWDGGVSWGVFFGGNGILARGRDLEWRGGLATPHACCMYFWHSVDGSQGRMLFISCDQEPHHRMQSSQSLPMHDIETMSSNCTSINATLMVHKKVSKQRIQKGKA